jgi:hypothetical protein
MNVVSRKFALVLVYQQTRQHIFIFSLMNHTHKSIPICMMTLAMARNGALCTNSAIWSKFKTATESKLFVQIRMQQGG